MRKCIIFNVKYKIVVLVLFITGFFIFKSRNFSAQTLDETFTVLDINPNHSERSLNKFQENQAETLSLKMASYLRPYFKYLSCNRTRPLAEEVVWRKGVYQHFQFAIQGVDYDTFILSFYLDDRFLASRRQRFLRAPFTLRGPGPLNPIDQHRDTLQWAWDMNKIPIHVLLWYEGFSEPVAAMCRHTGAAGLTRNVSNAYYYQQIMHCPLPEIDLLPAHASITRSRCGAPQTFVRVVYPAPARFPGARDIGVCAASLYGSMNSSRVPYLVSWMEALRLLGVLEVSLNNASFAVEDALTAAAFRYYTHRGFLRLTHYPVAHEQWPRGRKQDDDASESVNKLTTGDCFYRGLKRYWYTLIIDLDELPVPARHATYQQFLADLFHRQPNLTEAHCLAIRSAFFYMDVAPGRPEEPAHLPLLRYTRRFPPEPVEGSVDGVGLAKSFHNPRSCVSSGHHLCRVGHELTDNRLNKHFMSPDDILVHHYRAACKYLKACRAPPQLTSDDSVARALGPRLRARVEVTLQNIGYNTQ